MTTVCIGRERESKLSEVSAEALASLVRPAAWLIANPSLLYLAMLLAMLFRPPDLDPYHLDRIGFAVLIIVTLLRVSIEREPLGLWSPASLPMAGLLLLASASTVMQPFNPQAWSMLAAKFLVPFALFHLAQKTFADSRSLLHLETFSLAVLVYLIITAVAWLLGAKWLVFPQFILDESLGIHVDRARGPFLQAVANGVSLNVLGLMALNAFRRKRLRGVPAFVLIAALPLAILATMTRAVWFSFSASLVLVPIVSGSARLRRCCLTLVAIGIGSAILSFFTGNISSTLTDRAEESGPVEIRMAIYRASWEMIREKPLLGWGQNQMPMEVTRRMPDYHLDAYWAHNTYLEILVEEGLIGLALYVWMMVSLLLSGRRDAHHCDTGSCFDSEFRALWPIVLGVYLINAMFVVMNYQFVNALLFTLAGVLAGQTRRGKSSYSDVLDS